MLGQPVEWGWVIRQSWFMNQNDRLLTTEIKAGDLATADMFIPYIYAIVSDLTSKLPTAIRNISC